MSLHGDTAWTLEELVSVIVLINRTFTPPYTIVIYSLYSMGELQRAFAGPASPQRGSTQEQLQFTKFVIQKVRLECFQRMLCGVNALHEPQLACQLI